MKAPTSRYRSTRTPAGWRLVHNFFPGPKDDPGQDRTYGWNGFRYWVTREPNPHERRCYCGWLSGCLHFGTVGIVTKSGRMSYRMRVVRTAKK